MASGEERFGAGVTRRAAAMVAALGGGAVTLRTPAPPLPNDDGEQLGLATPLFEDMALCPVVWRTRGKVKELRVPGAVLEAALGLIGVEAVRESLESVATVTAGAESFAIETVDALEAFGQAYLYRLGCVPARG